MNNAIEDALKQARKSGDVKALCDLVMSYLAELRNNRTSPDQFLLETFTPEFLEVICTVSPWQVCMIVESAMAEIVSYTATKRQPGHGPEEVAFRQSQLHAFCQQVLTLEFLAQIEKSLAELKADNAQDNPLLPIHANIEPGELSDRLIGWAIKHGVPRVSLQQIAASDGVPAYEIVTLPSGDVLIKGHPFIAEALCQKDVCLKIS